MNEIKQRLLKTHDEIERLQKELDELNRQQRQNEQQLMAIEFPKYDVRVGYDVWADEAMCEKYERLKGHVGHSKIVDISVYKGEAYAVLNYGIPVTFEDAATMRQTYLEREGRKQ